MVKMEDVFAGLQDGRLVNVIHQSDADFNEQKVSTTQMTWFTDVPSCSHLCELLCISSNIDWSACRGRL